MLTTDISDYALKRLTEYFDKYCMCLYDRTYPLTDNNLIIYLKEVLMYHKYCPGEWNFLITKKGLSLKNYGILIFDGSIHFFDLLVYFSKQI